MVTVKKDTIWTKKFEEEVVKAINHIKGMALDEEDKNEILTTLRSMQNNCYEWGVPVENFKAFERRLLL